MADKALQRLEWLEAQLGIRFPREILAFWKLACALRPLEPLKAFEDSLGITLVGAFEVLSGKFDRWTGEKPLSLHWRYTLDPPEFFTLMARGNEGWHAGYLLDDVSGMFGCVASTYTDEGLGFTLDGQSLFEALEIYAGEGERFEEDSGEDWFEEMSARLKRFGPNAPGDQLQRREVVETMDGGGVPQMEKAPLLPSPEELSRLEDLIWSDNGFLEVLGEAKKYLKQGIVSGAWKLARDVWQVGDEAHLLGAGEILAEVYEKSARQPFQKILEDHLAELNRDWLDLAEST